MRSMKIIYRRRRMIELMLQGLKPHQILDMLKDDPNVDVKKSQLWDDWGSRQTWMRKLARLELDEQDIVKSEFFLQLKEARRLLMNTYLSSEGARGRIGALKEIRNNIQAELEMRQTLGLIEKQPLKIELTTILELQLIAVLKYLRENHPSERPMIKQVMSEVERLGNNGSS